MALPVPWTVRQPAKYAVATIKLDGYRLPEASTATPLKCDVFGVEVHYKVQFQTSRGIEH
jgi:hypothetical protein